MLLPVGAARHHGRITNGGVTHANSADIACTNPSKASSGAPLDAGNRSKASSSHELSFPEIQYQQGADDFCAYYGLASALHYSGETLGASELASAAAASKLDVSDTMVHVAEECRRIFKGRYRLVKMQVVKMDREGAPIWPLNFEPDMFYNIQFEDSNKFSRHCIAIYQELIFDSRHNKAKPLTKAGLDASCLGEGETFVKVLEGYCLYPVRVWPSGRR